MAAYQIHIPLYEHEGAKSGVTYTCTRGAIYRDVPEGEFKHLQPGRDYSRLDDAPDSSEPTDSE